MTLRPTFAGRGLALVLAAGCWCSTAFAEAALFDGVSGLVGIPSVAVGGATYVDVTLRHLGDLRFALQGASESALPASSAYALYDLATGSLRIPSVTVGCSTFTDVVLQDQGGFTFALAAATEKPPAPTAVLTITTPPANVNATPGQSAAFAVVVSGPGPYSYQWQRNGVDIPGATAASHQTLPVVTAVDHGALYTVRASNLATSVTSNVATLAVASGSPLPSINGDPVGTTSASLGSTPTLRVLVSGFAPRYQWRRNGVDIVGATATSYTLPALSTADDGAWFSVMVCNPVGCRTSQNAQVRIAGANMPRTTQVFAAGNHSLARRDDGSTWGWGQSLGGSIGLARPSTAVATQGHPARGMCDFFSPLTEVVGVAGGTDHSLALRSDGTLWAAGSSGRGQVGNGVTGASVTAYVPVQKAPGQPLQQVKDMAANSATSHAVTEDGSAWAWGSNQYNQLGDGTTTDRSRAVRVTLPGGAAFGGVRSVRAGLIHTLWLRGDGTVWAAGANNAGQIGDGSSSSRANPVRVETAAGVPLTGIIAIAAGGTHSLALKDDGTVFGWGSSTYGQVTPSATGQTSRPNLIRDAQGAPVTNVTVIAAGDGTSFFLLANGSVLAAGNNSEGRLGIGVSGGGGPPTPVRDAGGAVFGNVVAVATQSGHTLLLRSDGTVWGFGVNGSFNLADGSNTSRNAPVKVLGLAP